MYRLTTVGVHRPETPVPTTPPVQRTWGETLGETRRVPLVRVSVPTLWVPVSAETIRPAPVVVGDTAPSVRDDTADDGERVRGTFP